MDPKIDLQTLLAIFHQLVFVVRWRTVVVTIYILELVSGILKDFSMSMVLSCVDLVATVGRLVSDKIILEGVVLTCPVIALTEHL